MVIASCSQWTNSIDNISYTTKYFSHFLSSDTIFWTGNDGLHYADIENGIYYFESLDSSSRYNAPNFQLPKDRNYLIELALTGPDSEDSLTYGLIFGDLNDINQTIEFRINNAGQYLIATNEVLNTGVYSLNVNKQLKKIKIVHLGKDLYFMIEDKEVFRYPFEHFQNFRAGPITSDGSAIWMDYFRIEVQDI